MRPQKMILELLNARSEQAIEELRTHYGGLCRSIARRALDSPEDIEEILNDTLLAVWNQIPPDQPLSLSGYISRITRNLSLTRFRDSTADVRDRGINVWPGNFFKLLSSVLHPIFITPTLLLLPMTALIP